MRFTNGGRTIAREPKEHRQTLSYTPAWSKARPWLVSLRSGLHTSFATEAEARQALTLDGAPIDIECTRGSEYSPCAF